jgi:hypothetical protein
MAEEMSQVLQEKADLEKVGDALAHELQYKDHSGLLHMWWTLRKGQCHACDDSEHAQIMSPS